MGYDERREILERVEALERMMRSGGGERDDRSDHRHRGGDRDRDRDRGRGRGDRDGWQHRGDRDRSARGNRDFDEKHVIDTIVTLVCDHVGQLLEERDARAGRRDNGGDEKRLVDLIVHCVSEHVQEIVATELDRRFGRADAPRSGDAEDAGSGSNGGESERS
jgi:hypothetical protein